MAIQSHFCQCQNADVPLIPDLTHAFLLKTFENQFPITASSLQAMALTKINKEPSQMNWNHVVSEI
jgi:hypothetical protein